MYNDKNFWVLFANREEAEEKECERQSATQIPFKFFS